MIKSVTVLVSWQNILTVSLFLRTIFLTMHSVTNTKHVCHTLHTGAELGRVRRVRPHPRKNHNPLSLLNFHHVKLIFHGFYEGSAPPFILL
jgi:hypothetical protein